MTPLDDEVKSVRKAKRLKRNSIVILLLLLAGVALTLAQIWVTIELLPDSGVIGGFELAGSASAPLVALGLALAASIIALVLTGRFLRYFLSALILVLSITIGFSISQILVDPFGFAESRLAERAGMSGPGLEKVIESIEVSYWPWVTLVLIVGIALCALIVMITAHRWPRPSRKYSRDSDDDDFETSWGRFERDEEEPER